MDATIALALFNKTFDKSFINELYQDYKILYNEYLDLRDPKFNRIYFNPKNIGNYVNRNSDILKINQYFNGLLFRPNIEILFHILSNYEFWKNKIFIDNGSGINCFLSIFLAKIGIKCYNYDNFSQIGKPIISDYYKKYNIEYPCDNISVENLLKNNNVDCLLCSGIWVSNPTIIKYNFDYMMLDKYYIDHKNSMIKYELNKYKAVGNLVFANI